MPDVAARGTDGGDMRLAAGTARLLREAPLRYVSLRETYRDLGSLREGAGAKRLKELAQRTNAALRAARRGRRDSCAKRL